VTLYEFTAFDRQVFVVADSAVHAKARYLAYTRRQRIPRSYLEEPVVCRYGIAEADGGCCR
jgi:hypothetical protein